MQLSPLKDKNKFKMGAIEWLLKATLLRKTELFLKLVSVRFWL